MSITEAARETSERLEQRKSLAGQIAVITGASRGIGAAIAEHFARDGATVIVHFRERVPEADAVCDRIKEIGGVACAYQADIADRQEVEAMFDDLVREYGKLDVLVNNAGILRDRSFKNMQDVEWDAVLQTNLTGAFNACKAAVPHMIQSKRGCIINISSVIGQTGNFGQANYSAAKAGLIGFTKSLSLELARYSIRVNAIAPGFVDTEMWRSLSPDVQQSILDKIPLGRVASRDEIAEAVRYLVGASYVTGQTLNINGGLYLG